MVFHGSKRMFRMDRCKIHHHRELPDHGESKAQRLRSGEVSKIRQGIIYYSVVCTGKCLEIPGNLLI